VTAIPYVRTNDEQRYEAKATYSLAQGHSVQGTLTKINQVLKKPSMTRAIELGSSVTTNGLTRFTADVNQPIDTDAAVRVNMMFQRGKASTRDNTALSMRRLSPSSSMHKMASEERAALEPRGISLSAARGPLC